MLLNTAKLQARQDLQKLYYDKSSRDLPEVCPGDNVRVLNPFNHKWEPGVVKDREQAPKSYIVDMPSGSTLKRNRRHIRPSIESPNEGVGDNPSTSITATESSFPNNTSIQLHHPKLKRPGMIKPQR